MNSRKIYTMSSLVDEITSHVSAIQAIVCEEPSENIDSETVLAMTRMFHIAAEMLNGNLSERQYEEALCDYIDGTYCIEGGEEDGADE